MPLIVSWPGQFKSGAVSEALVELIDVAPTLLEAASVVAPERMQGRSLGPLLRGEVPLQRHRDFVRSEYYRALNPDAPGREHLQGPMGPWCAIGVINLVTYHDRDWGELFDIEEDPGEFDNRWAMLPMLKSVSGC